MGEGYVHEGEDGRGRLGGRDLGCERLSGIGAREGNRELLDVGVLGQLIHVSEVTTEGEGIMVLDLYFPLFAILAAYLIVGAVASVAAGVLLGPLLNRLGGLRSSIRAKRTSQVVVAAG